MELTLGHSPDPDDAFMFYALAKELIPTDGFTFKHILQDIQTLNQRALKAELDITAVSIHAYAYLQHEYALLRSGASMGDDYGPMLVGNQSYERDEIRDLRIAIPGRMTSAFLALQLYLDAPGDQLELVDVPFDQIFDAIDDDQADVGLIIHEGQLTYADQGLALSADLGHWWFEHTDGLPLPLGGNAIKKSLGHDQMKRISKVLTESIRYGLEHRADGIAHALPLGRGIDAERADRFIAMYVNELTLDYGDRGRRAIREFLTQAHDAGLIPAPAELEFV